jgi:hypothetical protein
MDSRADAPGSVFPRYEVDGPAVFSEAVTTHVWTFNRLFISARSAGEIDSNVTVISSKLCFSLQ